MVQRRHSLGRPISPSRPRFVGLGSVSPTKTRTGELRRDTGKLWPANVAKNDVENPLEVYTTPRPASNAIDRFAAESSCTRMQPSRQYDTGRYSPQSRRAHGAPLPVDSYVRLKYTKMNDCLGSGFVRYVGEVDGRVGVWYGVELDKPNGLHNGNPNSPLGIGRYCYCNTPN